MKTLISNIIVLMVSLLTQQIAAAQGTVYMSNVGQPSTGSEPAGSNSWLAAGFVTGTNASGYIINSIQLDMLDATGNPSDLTVSLYTSNIAAGSPDTELGALTGSLSPTTAGVYTYTLPFNHTFHPDTFYFIVLTAGTDVADGAYEWNLSTAHSYNPSGGWINGGPFLTSSNGSSWNGVAGIYPQFAITATAVPEPSPSLLLLLGSGIFIYIRRAFRS
jgi:hypothetical protein